MISSIRRWLSQPIVGSIVSSGVGVGVGAGVAVGAGVMVGAGVGVWVGVAVGSGVGVWVGVAVGGGVEVGAGVAASSGVDVGDAVAVGAGSGVSEVHPATMARITISGASDAQRTDERLLRVLGWLMTGSFQSQTLSDTVKGAADWKRICPARSPLVTGRILATDTTANTKDTRGHGGTHASTLALAVPGICRSAESITMDLGCIPWIPNSKSLAVVEGRCKWWGLME